VLPVCRSNSGPVAGQLRMTMANPEEMIPSFGRCVDLIGPEIRIPGFVLHPVAIVPRLRGKRARMSQPGRFRPQSGRLDDGAGPIAAPLRQVPSPLGERPNYAIMNNEGRILADPHRS